MARKHDRAWERFRRLWARKPEAIRYEREAVRVMREIREAANAAEFGWAAKVIAAGIR